MGNLHQGDGIVEYARSQDVLMVAYSPFSAYPFAMKANEERHTHTHTHPRWM